MDSLVRHRRSKVAETDRLILTVQLPVLYSTLNSTFVIPAFAGIQGCIFKAYIELTDHKKIPLQPKNPINRNCDLRLEP